MLKINLLPPYIYERKQIKVAIILSILGFLVVAGGMTYWAVALASNKAKLANRVAELERHAALVTQLGKDKDAIEAQIPIYKTKTDFIDNIMQYNAETPKLYEDVCKYTYNKIVYSSIACKGTTLEISAHAKSVGDCGRYLMNMYRARHLFSSVAISGVPGWPPGSNTGSSSGGGGGIPGMMGGGIPGLPTMGGSTGGGMMGGMLGGGGAAMGTAGSGASSQKVDLTKGFDFTVTCTLVKPISAPTFGAATSAAAGMSSTPSIPGMAGGGGGVRPGGMPAMPANMPPANAGSGGLPGMIK